MKQSRKKPAEPKPPAKPRTRYQIQVTAKDVEKAKRNDSYMCVVSQAIARTIPDATRIETDTQSIRFSRAGQRYVFLTPPTVQGYVVAFDAGDPIEPFQFQLRDPARTKSFRRSLKGKRAVTAADRARSAVRKAARHAGHAADDPAIEKDAREAAKAAYQAAIDSTADSDPIYEDTRGRRPIPRVFKRKRRSYGHRLLRINQQGSAASTPEQIDPVVTDQPS